MKISTITLTNYGNQPSGTISFYDLSGIALNMPLTREVAEKLMSVGYELFRENQQAMADQLANLTPAPLIGYDTSKTIEGDGDEIPF